MVKADLLRLSASGLFKEKLKVCVGLLSAVAWGQEDEVREEGRRQEPKEFCRHGE